MKANSTPLVGLRITLRDLLIAVAYSGVMSALVANLLKGARPDAYQSVARVLLLLSPWVLGGLIVLFERPGPIKDWLAASVLFAFYPALVLYHDVAVVQHVVLTGSSPGLAMPLLFNALILGSTALFYRRMLPIQCPRCAKRTLIPLIRLMGQSRRIQKTRWCASCGAQFWRDRDKVWRIERRTTWANAPHNPAFAPEVTATTPSAHSDSHQAERPSMACTP